MNLSIPTIKTIYTVVEATPTSYRREQYADDLFDHNDEYKSIESHIHHIVDFELEFNVPFELHYVKNLDNTYYQIEVYKQFGFVQQVDRLIDVYVENVLEFNGRYFKLGEEVEVDL